jgi:hypothetical protein
MVRFSLGWVFCEVHQHLGLHVAVRVDASFRPQVSWILEAAGVEGGILAAVVVPLQLLHAVHHTRSETLAAAAHRTARHFFMGML